MKKINNIYIGIITFVTFIIWYSAKWALITYSNLSMDEIIFHLNVPLGGVEESILFSYINYALLKTIILSVVVILFFNFINKFFKKNNLEIKISFYDKKYNLLIKYQKLIKYINLFLLVIFIVVIFKTIKDLEIDTYIKNIKTESSFIADNYVNPKFIKYEFPETKRNLIHITVESLESSYFNKENGGLVYDNLLANLEPYMKRGTSFSNTQKYGGASQITATGWTIAGLVAQSSGMPLKLQTTFNAYSEGEFTNVYQKLGFTTFLKGTTSLGDILNENGYNQLKIMGSDKAFGARELYYKQHGNYEIFDYESAITEGKIKSDYKVWWGFEDSKLFEYSKEKILLLSKDEKPFNVSILTANTHFPDGYTEETCETLYEEPYSNSIICSVNQIVDFLKWIESQDFYKNTTIVITGDHLSMDKNYFENIPYKDRKIFNLFLNSAVQTKNTTNREFSSLDIFPTILSSLGVKYNTNRLALGTDLFSEEKTLLEEYGITYVNKNLSQKSIFYDNHILYNK